LWRARISARRGPKSKTKTPLWCGEKSKAAADIQARGLRTWSRALSAGWTSWRRPTDDRLTALGAQEAGPMGLFSKWTAAKSERASLSLARHSRRPRTWHGMRWKGKERVARSHHLAAVASRAGCSLLGAAAIGAAAHAHFAARSRVACRCV